MKANYHTHTKLCGHAIGMSEEYILEAIKNGFEEIGFSDHGPIPRYFMTENEYQNNMLYRQMNEEDFEEKYLVDLDSSIKKYSSLISIKKGLEIEYLSNNDEYYLSLLDKLDYLSLGVHYFATPSGLYNSYDSMSISHIEYYAEAIENALKTRMFTILNHPDLYLLNYTDSEGNLIFDETCELVARRIIEASVKYGVYLEINGGGPRRGKLQINGANQYYYPRNEFWRIVEEYKEAKIILGCDTHNPVELYDECIKELEEYTHGFNFNITNKITFNK